MGRGSEVSAGYLVGGQGDQLVGWWRARGFSRLVGRGSGGSAGWWVEGQGHVGG